MFNLTPRILSLYDLNTRKCAIAESHSYQVNLSRDGLTLLFLDHFADTRGVWKEEWKDISAMGLLEFMHFIGY